MNKARRRRQDASREAGKQPAAWGGGVLPILLRKTESVGVTRSRPAGWTNALSG